MDDNKLPNRQREIIEGLDSGKTREQLAQEFKHKDTQALNMYMRRHGYVWSQIVQNFVPKESHIAEASRSSRRKSIEVIASFKLTNDPKEVARRTGFADHRKLAEYMESQGYKWDMTERNYVQVFNVDEAYSLVESVEWAGTSSKNVHVPPSIDISQVISIVQMMTDKSDRDSESGQIPRYLIPGGKTSKSVQIATPLDNILTKYVEKTGANQRQVFEAALVQYLRHNGMNKEIESVLQR